MADALCSGRRFCTSIVNDDSDAKHYSLLLGQVVRALDELGSYAMHSNAYAITRNAAG